MKKISKLIFALICLFTVCACNKEDVSPQEPQTLLSKVIYATSDYAYTYNENGRLETVIYTANTPEYNYISSFIYDSEGRIIESKYHYPNGTSSDYRYEISYKANGDYNNTYFYYEDSTNYDARYEFIYAAGQLTIKTYSYPNILNNSTIYTFTANGKNIDNYKSYSADNILKYEYIYENFDSLINYASLAPKGYYVSPRNANNHANYKFIDHTSIPAVQYLNSYEYEYNSDGYATKSTSDNGIIIQYEYIKQ